MKTLVSIFIVAELLTQSVARAESLSALDIWEQLEFSQRAQLFTGNNHYLDAPAAVKALIADHGKNSGTTRCESPRAQKSGLQIYIGLGYFNGEYLITEDLLQANALDIALTEPCNTPGFEICGFTKISSDPDRYTRVFSTENGPDLTVSVDVESSSYTHYDYANRTTYAAEQTRKSNRVAAQFYSALETYDVVLYAGHSRDGGGPDFAPPVFLPGYESLRNFTGDKVNYGYYHQSRLGLQNTTTAVANRIDPLTLGLFSCSSSGHFFDDLSPSLAPSSRLFLTTNLTDSMFEGLLVGLNGVITNQCDEDLLPLLKIYRGTIRNIN